MLASALALFLLLSASPAPPRVMLMPLAAGDGVAEKTAGAVSDALAAELRRQPGLQLITRTEISAILSLERQKQLLGCQTDSCIAELGGALDADRMILGNVARVGESWIVHVQLLDPRKVGAVAQADRRHRGGSIDDILDDIPGMVRELFSGQNASPASSPAPVASAPAAPSPTPLAPAPTPPAPMKAPQPWADEPMEPSSIPANLELVTNGAGRYLAYVPFNIDGPLFASSDGRSFYAQLIFGGGAEEPREFDLLFWEPRSHVPAEAEFKLQDGAYALTCGKKKLPYTRVPAEKATAMMKGARFFKPRWHRQGYALARDDEGTYYYVDQPREPRDDSDIQLYIGTRGSMAAVPTRVLARDPEGDVLATGDGKLKLSQARQEAEWIQGQEHHPLKLLELRPNAPFIYTLLGVYKGEALGTPCDGAF